MAFRVLAPEETKKVFELAESPYRPKEILDLKAQIDSKTRLAEFRASVEGVIDEDLVHEIVQMKFRLDSLYSLWI